MAGGEYRRIAVSRRIGAPASVIFPILADPGRHREFDGSGMLRGVLAGATISGVGEVFVMKMYVDNAEPGAERPARWGQRWSFELTPDGPDATVVTEIFGCSQVPEDQRVDIGYGNIWVEGMRQTLERLDRLSAGPPGAATPG
jgi:hypothetical protein